MHPSVFTSESVTEGHPDKVADAVSDAILDAALVLDPRARVACETFVTPGHLVLGGEITAAQMPDLEGVARETVARVGYEGVDDDFDAITMDVTVRLGEQSPDISAGVDRDGAGDQGIMFGFAVDQTPELMPLPIQLAHRLAERLAEVRKTGKLPYLRPDGKTQVMVSYEGDVPVAVSRVLISAHNDGTTGAAQMREDLWELVVTEVIPPSLRKSDPRFDCNPTGRFEKGGPAADAGLTGRKIIVDTYGGYARHGGGAFSGKDATKVDRSGAYAARWAAKNIVAAGLASKAEIQLAYAIGQTEPFSVNVDAFGTETIDLAALRAAVHEVFDFSPAAIIDTLGLRRPVFSPTSAYGHFGRNGFSWERLDRVEALKGAVGL